MGSRWEVISQTGDLDLPHEIHMDFVFNTVDSPVESSFVLNMVGSPMEFSFVSVYSEVHWSSHTLCEGREKYCKRVPLLFLGVQM